MRVGHRSRKVQPRWKLPSQVERVSNAPHYFSLYKWSLKADDGSRTRDLKLGKLALYQLSYVRLAGILGRGGGAGAVLELEFGACERSLFYRRAGRAGPGWVAGLRAGQQ